jgi:ABC-type transport system involved in multi-copper enzyme maturation permease subunit
MGFAAIMLPLWMQPLGTVLRDAAIILAVMLVAWYALRNWVPKVGAIAHTTAKEAVSQPLFYVILAIGIFAILIFPFIPYNTFGEDVKILKAEGLTLIKLLGVILGLWTASVSIADEIEGRTALTLLSKPVRRWQLIVGKFLGIIGPVALVFLILGVLFLGSVSYKVVYDSRESSNPDPTSQQCNEEMQQIVPGLVLALMETIILVSISVAISTRLPMLPNLVIGATVYVLGHLVPMLVDSSMARFEIVQFVGKFLAAVIPQLDHFSVEPAISTGQKVPMVYLLFAGAYAALYTTVAMLLGLLLFEDRDLA